MKKKAGKNGFVLSIIINLVLNLEWTVPAWIFLFLHFWKGISLWWFSGSIILWLIFVCLKIFVFSSLTRAGDYKDAPKENKNPYSNKNKK